MKSKFTFSPLKARALVFLSCLFIVTIFTAAFRVTKPQQYHTGQELHALRLLQAGDLPMNVGSMFIGSGKCAGCHGIDLADPPYANITFEGENVSPAENWRATMMANSSKDPMWRAKVSHEVAINPGHGTALTNKCTSCHAPQGRFQALHDGIPNFTMEMLETDSLANDGVSCGACHQQQIESTGNLFSGELHYNVDTIWGPVFNIPPDDFPMFSSAMASFVGKEPVANSKFSQSETCAGCHTLITETVDLSGNFTGTTFIEQATYHEWLNSSFNASGAHEDECQGCHMPRSDESIVVASGYSFLPHREPYGQHWLVGGNSFMLELMKNRINMLGITATEDHFSTVIDRTLNLLQNQTATLELTQGEVDGDTARFTVKIENNAGHKFPSGYPARRAYVEFVMTDDNGNEIFHSGKLNPLYEVQGQDPNYEEHYDLITDDMQVQIYEMVMADVNGNVTTVLERAHHFIKDNRLVPLGFTTSHAAYDSTQIVGAALTDPNFNYINGSEGTGTDEIRYHIPVTGISGNYHVSAKLMYQSLPPKWNAEMFSIDDPVINAFEEMYWEEGADPVQIAMDESSVTLVGVKNYSNFFSVGPNPTDNGVITIQSGNDQILEVNLYSIDGDLIQSKKVKVQTLRMNLPDTPGTYLLDIKTSRGRRIEKILRQ